jgi:hypothetical protein
MRGAWWPASGETARAADGVSSPAGRHDKSVLSHVTTLVRQCDDREMGRWRCALQTKAPGGVHECQAVPHISWQPLVSRSVGVGDRLTRRRA